MGSKPGTDFETIQQALLSARVKDRAFLLAIDDTYTLASDGIIVDKAVTICGESREGTIFGDAISTTTPYVFLVTVSGVTFKRLTVKSQYDAAIILSGTGSSDGRVTNFLIDDVRVEFMSAGIILRACGWAIKDSDFVRQGNQPSPRAIIVYGVCNACAVLFTQFSLGTPDDTRAIYVTSSSPSRRDEYNYGVLSVILCRVHDPISTFFMQDNFRGPKRGLVLDFENNYANEVADWALAYSTDKNDGDIFDKCIFRQNTASGNNHSGFLSISGSVPTTGIVRSFRSIGGLPIYATGNVFSTLPCSIQLPFMESQGSADCMVAFNREAFSADSCGVQPQTNVRYLNPAERGRRGQSGTVLLDVLQRQNRQPNDSLVEILKSVAGRPM